MVMFISYVEFPGGIAATVISSFAFVIIHMTQPSTKGEHKTNAIRPSAISKSHVYILLLQYIHIHTHIYISIISQVTHCHYASMSDNFDPLKTALSSQTAEAQNPKVYHRFHSMILIQFHFIPKADFVFCKSQQVITAGFGLVVRSS